MKKADYLIIQSTNTSEVKVFGKEEIIKKHTSSIRDGGFGWNRPGFDYLVLHDGTLQTILNEVSPTSVDLWGISEGKGGIIGTSKHIAYVGGRTLKETWSKDSRTEHQISTLEAVVKFYILRFPNIIVLGMDEIESKSMEENPGFNVAEWLEKMGVPEQNIFKK
ncbi:N-acetylmuramoyl-L-alanine amidase [Flavivirga rizhaonensis]|uniref:N-acetylmuramoyl-L-alanine amidase n=1 Tax=Flavivirga rizhaonensis TaxID=2559571 RepID=A0A4S1E022_9FLAO|nr:N-acetylmuramoyl-L-alanine amidase [Flavivirga rizhaonensis]TGV03635.1 N-acetylmuramoyl-L-alanine amidase [Flavivirga rizhaonensis]